MAADHADEISSYTGPAAPSALKFMSDSEDETPADDLSELVREYLRSIIVDDPLLAEIVRRCGDSWCLYTKHKKRGKRRRLGTHLSKAAAYRQERAIKMHGG